MKILDPYRPENGEEAKEKLIQEKENLPIELFAPLAAFAAIIDVVLVVKFGTLPAFLMAGVSAAVAAAMASFLVRRERRLQKQIALLEEEQFVDVNVSFDKTETLATLGEILRQLPRSQREEVRGLWTHSIEAVETLQRFPHHEEARQRLHARLAEAELLIIAHLELEAAAAEDRRKLLLVETLRQEEDKLSTDDSDLLMAAMQRKGLEAGRQRYQQLGELS